MTTHFITAEIDLQESPVQLNQAIETELQKRGEHENEGGNGQTGGGTTNHTGHHHESNND